MSNLEKQSPYRIPIEGIYLLGVLLAVVWLVFFPALNGPLLLDDVGSVVTSKITELSIAEVERVATSNNSGIFGRPIPVITFALNYYIWPDSVVSLKVTNLVIHTINTALVFILAVNIFVRSNLQESRKHTTLLALTVTLFWAIHPLQVSTVMYVVQRMTLLMTLFTLISLLSYIKFRKKPPRNALTSLLAILLILGSAVLACLCKENGALVFAYFLLLEITLFRSSIKSFVQNPTASAIPLFCCYIPIMIGIFGVALLFEQLTTGYSYREYDMFQRLITEPGIVAMYLNMIVLPDLNDMYFYHDNYPIESALNITNVAYISLFAILLAVSALTFRKHPVVAIGISFFFISHIVESTFIPLELVFEHRNYFAIFGIAMLGAWVFSFAIKHTSSRVIKIIPISAILILLGPQTHGRSLEWSNSTTLHNFAFNANPSSVRARTSLAIELFNQKKFDKSISLLREGVEIHPGNVQIASLMFHLLAGSGNLTQQDVDDMTQLISTGKITKAVVFELVNIHRSAKSGTIHINPAILKSYFEIAIRRSDKYLAPQTESMLLANFADLLADNNDTNSALIAINRAIELDDTITSYHTLRSIIVSAAE